MSAMLCQAIYQSRSPAPDVYQSSSWIWVERESAPRWGCPWWLAKTKVSSAPPLTFMHNKPCVSTIHAQHSTCWPAGGRKKSQSIKSPPCDTHKLFLKTSLTTKRPPNPTSPTTEQLQKRCCLRCYSQQRVFAGRQIRNTNTKKEDGLGDRSLRDESPPSQGSD